MNANIQTTEVIDADGVIIDTSAGRIEEFDFDELLREANAARVAPRSSWVPFFKNVAFSRRVLAVIEDRQEAFEYRAAAAQEAGHPVCARECRVHNGVNAPRAWFIY